MELIDPHGLLLSSEEIQALTGYRRPAQQLAELHRQGFPRARRDRFGRVVVERAHYAAVCAGLQQIAQRPRVKPPAVKPAAVKHP